MLSCNAVVEAYTASWIEIRNVTAYLLKTTSKPIRLRGLKSPNSLPLPCGLCRSLYGFGLKSGSTISFEYGTAVEAYTASWIEISFPLELIGLLCVEAYTASWIEIVPQTQHPSHWHLSLIHICGKRRCSHILKYS